MRTRDADLNLARREAILDAAATCFVRQGFHATSMKDICAEAGMSPGTLYHYVRSKSDVIAGIIQEQEAFLGELVQSLLVADDFERALFETIDEIVADTTDEDLVLDAEIAAEVLRQPQLRAQAAATEDLLIGAFADAIARAQAAGMVDRTRSAHDLAIVLASLLDGLFRRGSLRGMDAVRRELPTFKSTVTALIAPTSGMGV